MTTPNVGDMLTTTSGAWHTAFTYKVTSISGSTVILKLAQPDGTLWTNNHDIKYDTSTGVWSDHNLVNDPQYLTSTSTYAQTTSTSSYPTSIHCWGSTTNDLKLVLTAPSWAQASGTSVSQSRSAHSGTVTESLDNTLSAPNPGIFYEKTGQHRFQIKYFDQTDSITGYNVTVAWQTSSGTVSDTQSVSTASGDLQLTYNFSANNASDQPITGAITVSFDVDMYYNGTEYVAGNTVLTFQYYSVGPYAASFSPATGIPGQPITVNIADDNPYPDENSTLQFEQTPGGSLISATLSNANNYSLSINQAFTSEVGTYKIYDSDNNVVATATYTDAPEQNGRGGNYDDRFPLITTNLFNRQRSVYAIGMTHKDTWDLFL